jgi:hypothetical protein
VDASKFCDDAIDFAQTSANPKTGLTAGMNCNVLQVQVISQK